MTSRAKITETRILALILILFGLLGSAYALVTPVFEASDELWHYPLVRHLADGNPLPVQVFDPAAAGPWHQEASQPPLYYYAAAALTFWVDTSDTDQIRWLNPHVDNGVISRDGNINLAIHDPAADPWRGTLLAVRIIRLGSVLLGAATVYLTYRIAAEVAPGRPELALGAAAANAFLPMFLFISGAVNNDNLVIPLASLSLLLMIQLVSRPPAGRRDEIRRYALLGLVIGLGALTKITAVGLLGIAAVAAIAQQWPAPGGCPRGRAVAATLLRAAGRWAIVFAVAFLIAGWWYVRNARLYGDWSGWNAFIAVLGQRAHPAGLAQLWDERRGFMMAYWGLFGGLNVPMAAWVYHILNGVALVAAAGLALYLTRLVRNWALVQSVPRKLVRLLESWLIPLLRRHFALLICFLWTAAVVVGLVRWATVTWSSQGRLVFSAISALSTLMVVGLAGWLPRRPAALVVILLSGFMLVAAAAAPFVWIGPAYQAPRAAPPADLIPVDETFGGLLRLEGYRIEPEEVRPGDSVRVDLVWQVLAETDRDWSVFVHLEDPTLGAPIAQRDMYPGQGLRPTSLLAAGEQIVNTYVVDVPASAIAPADLTIIAGLYDFATGERLPAADGRDAVTLARLPLRPRPGEVPNPLTVSFEDELEFVGFELAPRRLPAGDAARLTLYWRPQRPLSRDYTFFAQIVDEDTTRWASNDVARPTASWPPGEVQAVELNLAVDPAAPAGIYPLIVGVYTRTPSGGFDRLQTLTAEGRLTDDFFVLTPVRVE